MRKLTILAALVATCLAGSVAWAQGLIDQGKNLVGGGQAGAPAAGAAAGAATGGAAKGLGSMLSMDKILDLLKQQGYSSISSLAPAPEGNLLKASAVNSSGSPVDLLINPSTGQVVSALLK